jgi:hypothetical protein
MPSPQPAAMVIRVSDPTVLPALIGDLEQRAHHYVVKQTGPDTLAVSVLGSFKDGGELDLTLFLLAWQVAHPQTTINLEH